MKVSYFETGRYQALADMVATRNCRTDIKVIGAVKWQRRAWSEALMVKFTIRRGGFVTLLNEVRKKGTCREPSGDCRTPGVHRRCAEAAVRRG